MKSLVLALHQKKELIRSSSLAILIFLVPALVQNQAITGPLINALLILSLFYLGKGQAFFLALIPSTVALARGLLPVALTPLLPFIMMSNCLYLQVFALADQKFKIFTEAKKNSQLLTVLLAATIKAVFLLVIMKFLIMGLFSPALAVKLQQMMSWAQLWTAFVGGLVAMAFIRYVK